VRCVFGRAGVEERMQRWSIVAVCVLSLLILLMLKPMRDQYLELVELEEEYERVQLTTQAYRMSVQQFNDDIPFEIRELEQMKQRLKVDAQS